MTPIRLVFALAATILVAPDAAAEPAREYNLREEWAQLKDSDKAPFDDFKPILGHDFMLFRVPVMRNMFWEFSSRRGEMGSSHPAPESPMGAHLGNGLFLDSAHNLSFLLPSLLSLDDASSYTLKAETLSGMPYYGSVTRVGDQLEIRTANAAVPPTIIELAPNKATRRIPLKKDKFISTSVELKDNKAEYSAEGKKGKWAVTMTMEKIPDGVLIHKSPLGEETKLLVDSSGKTLAFGDKMTIAREGSLVTVTNRPAGIKAAAVQITLVQKTKTGIFITVQGPDKPLSLTKLQPDAAGLLRIEQSGESKAESVTLYRLEKAK